MPEPQRHRVIAGQAFARALADAGVVSDLDRVARIVIDIRGGEAVKLYVEYFGDERLLKVAQTLEGIEISGVPAEVSRG